MVFLLDLKGDMQLVDMCLPVVSGLPSTLAVYLYLSCSFSPLVPFRLVSRIRFHSPFALQLRVYNLLLAQIWLFHLIKCYVLFQLVHWYYLCLTPYNVYSVLLFIQFLFFVFYIKFYLSLSTLTLTFRFIVPFINYIIVFCCFKMIFWLFVCEILN